MSNSEITKTFFAKTEIKVVNEILAAIAAHYEITNEEAREEVEDIEAEHLLDYLKGSMRIATSVLMQKQGLV